MYSEAELEQLKYHQLYALCKRHNLPRYIGRGRISRATLINNLLEYPGAYRHENPPVSKLLNCSEEEIEKAAIGDVLAFRITQGKALSGKMVARSRKRKKIKAETKKGDVFLVDYKDVLWFKNDNSWPKPIYDALKG